MKRTGWFNEEGAKRYKEIISDYYYGMQEAEELEEELETAEREIERIESVMAEISEEIAGLDEEKSIKMTEAREKKENLNDLDSDDEQNEDAICHYKATLEDLETAIEDLQSEKSRLREEIDDLEDKILFKNTRKNELERRLENIQQRNENIDDIKEELECLEIVKRIDAVCENDGEILVSESFKASRMYHYIFHHEYIYTGREARDLIGFGWRNAIAGRMRIFPVRAEEVEQFPDGSIRCAPYVFQKENIFGDFDGSEKGFILSFQNPE